MFFFFFFFFGWLTRDDIRTEKANDVVQNINTGGTERAISVVGDVTDQNYIHRLVKEAAEFGNGKIHIIVNNAGFTWDAVIHKVRGVPPRIICLLRKSKAEYSVQKLNITICCRLPLTDGNKITPR
jgi:NAD(P)-dependent dehydrogenase (short-subunit alcohol dehydrogenase family)